MKKTTDWDASEKEWPLRAYTKMNLAMAYSPEITPDAAVNRLRRWIKHHEALHKALIEVGYTPHQHLLSPMQVQLIFQYLGRP